MNTTPDQAVRAVVALVASRYRDSPLRLGIDGVDGVGKTTFADTLARELRTAGTEVVRVGVDGFHRPRTERYRRGRHDPLGYWLDSFDHDALVREVLAPLAATGDRRVRTSVFDHRADAVVESPPVHLGQDAVLVLDGVFLHMPVLRRHLDLTVFLDAPFDISVARMGRRDGTPTDPRHPAVHRYVEGQRLYLAAVDPARTADVLVDATDPAAFVVRRLPPGPGRLGP